MIDNLTNVTKVTKVTNISNISNVKYQQINNLIVKLRSWGNNSITFVPFVPFNTMRTCFKVKPIAWEQVKI